MPCTMTSRMSARLTSGSRIIQRGHLGRQIIPLVLSVLSLAAGLAGCKNEEPFRPNLVLVTVDRLAADRLACFGGPSDAGGSICALGQQGTLFAWTATPGRSEASGAATVLTGSPEAIHGVGQDGQSFLATAHRSIAEDLSEAGYATAAFVASPRVNRSRRLGQGFDLYDDRLASPSRRGRAEGQARDDTGQNVSAQDITGSVDLSASVRAWIDAAPSPWFVWLHADREAGLVELDRLFSRLSQTLEGEDGGPGILFLALRGEHENLTAESGTTTEGSRTIGWRSHRVPLIWRPSTRHRPDGQDHAAVSRRLASLMDIRPTLRTAAHLTLASGSKDRDDEAPKASPIRRMGRVLGARERDQPDEATSQERFLLLVVPEVGGEVGLASQNHLYTRHASPLDGTGRPVQTSSLIPLAARFSTLPKHDPLYDPTVYSARLEPGPWRKDVLDAESPVPRLEFHLARQLEAQRDARGNSQQDRQERRGLE
jgi:hypothetical protein